MQGAQAPAAWRWPAHRDRPALRGERLGAWGGATHVQNDQHRCLHRRRAAERQDKPHGAPDAEANEDERDEDQLLIHHGAVVLEPVRLGEDGPVLGERLVLRRTRAD